MFKYPYGDSQQLNLDWIINTIKDLEAAGASDLETVSKALISLPYNTTTSYRRYDYAFLNGKLYRCITDTSGVFNPTAWQEALIGDDLAVLTRWINAIDAAAVVDVKFDTSGTNGKIQQKYHDEYHDVVEVDYAPVQDSKRPLSSNAGYELNTALGGKAPTSHASTATTYGKGTSSKYGHVKLSDSLTNTTTAASGGLVPSMKAVSDLNNAIAANESAIAIVSINNTHAAITTGQYVYIKEHTTLTDGLYKARTNISANEALSTTNVLAVSNGGLNSVFANSAGILAAITANDTYCEITQQTCKYFPDSGLKVLQIQIHTIAEVPTTMPAIIYLPAELAPSTVVVTNFTDTNNNVEYHCIARVQSGTRMIQAREGIPTNLYLSTTVCYF